MNPIFLYKSNENWSMEKLQDGNYQTTQPNSSIGKIGNSYPPKRKFTYEYLIANGWSDKHYDCNVCRTRVCSCKYSY